MDAELPREKRAATAKVTKYKYSPAFVSADDAARYAHERIGTRRDVEYGSVILQRVSDNKIFATEPISGKSATFDFSLLLERGVNNQFVEPPGYKLLGALHSHPDQFIYLKKSNPRFSDRQVRIFNSFFSERDVVFNHYEGRALGTAYVSGPNGTLLKYQSGFSQAERQFVDWIDEVKTAPPAHGHDGSIEGFIRKLASLGRLSLLTPSEDWGGAAGVIDQRWQPYLPLAATQETIACGPLFPTVEQALNHAQVRMRRKPEVRQMVMLLRHEQQDEFVATQALALSGDEHVPADNRLPSLTGGPFLPPGLHVHGFFYLSRSAPAQLPKTEPWLYPQFFSPAELAAYIAKARRYLQAPVSALGLSVYLRTRDNALLRYRFSGSPAETQLFRVDEQGVVSDQGIQQALDRGTMTPRQFVARVAEAGELTVEQTSSLWDVAGMVGTDWVPYATFPLQGLKVSPPFASADEAALYAHAQMDQRRGREYAALILKRPDQRYVLTQALESGSNPYKFQGFYPWDSTSQQLALPDGYQLHAWVGSHRAQSAGARMNWSNEDNAVYAQSFTDQEAYQIHQLQVPGYLSGAKDSLIVLDPVGAEQAEFLKFYEAPRGGSLIARNLADGTFTPADAVRTLAQVSRLRIVQGNSLWGPVGPVDRHWVPFAAGKPLPKPVAAGGGKAVVALPTLSPAFVHADDAAFWAHKRIGARREREYGGVILRNPQRYFFATEPFVGSAETFDVRKVLNRAPDGSVVAPSGYRLIGIYHSHPAVHASVALENPEFSAQQVKAFVNFFSIDDVIAEVVHQKTFSLSYLSGPDDSLIRYKPSGSAQEALYVKWLNGELRGRPVAADDTVEGDIQTLARIGELSFVVASDVWGGSRGVVPAHWQPYTPFVQHSPALLPLLTKVCDQVTDAINAGVEGSEGAKDTWRLGLIFKRDDKAQYVATHAVHVKEPRFLVTQFLSTDQDGFYRVPDGHRIAGFYCEPPAERTALAVAQPWLYRSFFPALGLATAAHQAHLIASLQTPEQPLGLYQQAPGGALLRYQFSYSEAEAGLYHVAEDGLVGDHDLEAPLLTGTLTPQEYVLRVAAAGMLTVLSTDRIWDRAGRVTADWRPFSSIPPITTGPAFVTADDAARWAHAQIGERRDKEYGGAILKRGNHYFATEPVSGAQVLFDFRTILALDDQDNFIAPHPYQCTGLYHSHPADDGQIKQHNPQFTEDQVELFGSFYSPADQVFAITHRGFSQVHYLSGAQGSLLRYVSSGSTEEKSLLGQLTGSVAVEPSTAFEGAVRRLAKAGELKVVVPSPVWGGSRGKVPHDWTLRSAVSPAGTVSEQPFFTPVAGSAQVAVLLALSLPAHLPQARYQGVVLQHLGTSTYIATEPTVWGASLTGLFPLRENGQPRLPSNYRLVGFYYSAAPLATAALSALEPWLYKRFVSPLLLVTAMNQAASTRNLQIGDLGLKLFLHTDDKALLQWQMPDAAAATELFRVAADGTVSDNGNHAALMTGSLSPRGFVRRVIRAGDLAVLQQGRLWNAPGPLSDDEYLPLGLPSESPSATFLSADDAARHAHERIGVRRDAAYGGYILQRADQRFAFTEPVRIQGDGFAGDLLLPSPGNGLLVPPKDHVIHARYSSHPPQSHDELARWRRLGWTTTDLEVSTTMFTDIEIRSVIQSRMPAYLSGSPNSLIGYFPSGSANELLVLANANREPGIHSYHQRLETGVLKPQDIVTRLADAGELRVLVQSRLWGARVRVYADWTPNFEYAGVAPQTPSFSAIFMTQDAAAINAHIRSYGRNLDVQAYTSYVLKHPQKNEYVVSELAPGASGRRLSDSSLGAAYLQGGDFAHGFVLVGLLHSQQWLPSGLPPLEAWLTRFFATPQLLQRAEDDVRYLARSSAQGGLPIYLSTLEGALLRYQPPATSLFTGGSNGDEVAVQDMSLRRGTLDIRRFVSLMAQTGDLTVLYSTPCWDRRAAVNKAPSQWRPYANFVRRRLGPAFYDQDDAARYAQSRLKDINGRRLSGGLILKRPDGLFVATEPVSVLREDFDPKWIFPDEVVAFGGFPAAHTLVARYRSSPGRELPFALDAMQRDIYRNMLSTRVISAALSEVDASLSREYLFGSDGCVLSYSCSHSAQEAALKSALQPLNLVREDRLENALEHQIRAGELNPEDFVTRLGKAGTLRVVQGSKVWGPPRVLLGTFFVNAPVVPAMQIQTAIAEPALSPLFAQPEAAVRYAQERCQYGNTLQFGYVLKSSKKDQYMVTLPLARQNYWKYEQVFPKGLFPQGYVLEGIYLCASLEPQTPGQDPHEGLFHSPSDVDNGVRFGRFAMKGKQLTLYLACPEGALIRYQYLGSDEALSENRYQVSHQQLREGKITILDYVHDLARHGNVDVLVQGRVWAGTLRIRPDWKPGTTQAFYDFPICGPLFSHADDAARDIQRGLSSVKGHNYVAAILTESTRSSFTATLPVWPGVDNVRLLRLFYTGRTGPVQPLVSPVDEPVPYPVFPTDYQAVGAQLIYLDKSPIDSPTDKDGVLSSNFIEPSLLSYFVRILKAHHQPMMSLYVAPRGGGLLKYVPDFSVPETQLMVSAASLKPTEFLMRLSGVGQLLVLDRDNYWRQEGLLSEVPTGSRRDAQTDLPLTDEVLPIRERDEL
ncbi:DUF4329 domain-containing protein [Pseudomonas sp. MAFF 301449]|uniref:DUF4329 domain-containing protein n=1 Tax=Pseudomonas cyclaminis TaxID=2781239 RepID=A0ABR9SPJ5_9PSED|nr:DUF4329 domain-containing protein [Pseudomonas cyclaminis]MBE8590850.1 DUF4329 domain-containing protein [Pseudomonas cyclaminis]MBE8599024.1 DUF4329 domain-containing protein [Pseudomonas cyclaminis]